jgi:hypothetical protein
MFAPSTKNFELALYVDGEPAKQVGWNGVHRWLLKPGKQNIKLRFISAETGKVWPGERNILIYVTNADGSIKMFPVSTRARKSLQNSRYDIKVSDQYIVQQKKIIKLPPYSIAVGTPEKVNYAFNTRSCSINGLWSGDLLNIGPNIGGRGKDGSIPLGDWVFHFPSQLAPKFSPEQVCQFIKYRVGDAPEFYFSIDGISLMLTGVANSNNSIRFTYKVVDNPKNVSRIELTLPEADKMTISSSSGSINNGRFTIDAIQISEFTLSFSFTGAR